MKQEPKLPLKFPKSFLWGASSSAHQVEGDNHNQWSVWELENAQVLAGQAKYKLSDLPKWSMFEAQAAKPENYISGMATDHYNRYDEDFALLKRMNMNAWRFSIEWSRIEPQEGAWSAEAIEHYRVYLKKLKSLGIEPFVTFWHWTCPNWFEQLGGWEKRSNIRYFERFASKILEEFGQDFRYVITLNEPETYVVLSYVRGDWPPQKHNKKQAMLVLMNLLTAHKRIYKLAHRAGRKFKVGLAKSTALHYAGDDAKLSRISASVARYASEYFIIGRIKKQSDFIGVNFYRALRYYGYRLHESEDNVSDLGWEMQPDKIEPVIKDLYERYNLPIIITENGVADCEDGHRKWWLQQTLMAMHRLLQSGVKLEGYLYWSLTDNFELSYGSWPRFGLAEVDYSNFERKLRPSALWLGGVIKKVRQ